MGGPPSVPALPLWPVLISMNRRLRFSLTMHQTLFYISYLSQNRCKSMSNDLNELTQFHRRKPAVTLYHTAAYVIRFRPTPERTNPISPSIPARRSLPQRTSPRPATTTLCPLYTIPPSSENPRQPVSDYLNKRTQFSSHSPSVTLYLASAYLCHLLPCPQPSEPYFNRIYPFSPRPKVLTPDF